MLTALTRKPCAALAACQLEYLARDPIDPETAIRQHQAYEACLAELGAQVVSLPAEASLPDSVFVEDPAVVVDEAAVITRLSSPSRRPEQDSLSRALAPYRELYWLSEPATLEGGDVLRIGKTLYVGLSRRTNVEGIAQLSAILAGFGYAVVAAPIHGCLHLKTACCSLVDAGGDGWVLANRAWFSHELAGIGMIDVPVEEPWGANVLRIGDTVLVSAASPRTAELLDRLGYRIRTLDISEFLKAEAGLTCLSLLFDAPE